MFLLPTDNWSDVSKTIAAHSGNGMMRLQESTFSALNLLRRRKTLMNCNLYDLSECIRFQDNAPDNSQ